MARVPELLVSQSLLERLNAVDEWPVTRTQSIRALRDSIKRNLEWLLNSRHPPINGLEYYSLAKRSVLRYGLIDIGSLNFISGDDQQYLLQSIAEAVEYSEPRLAEVKVRLDEEGLNRKKLRFNIEARMQMKPEPEEIAFTTVLDLATGEYEVD